MNQVALAITRQFVNAFGAVCRRARHAHFSWIVRRSTAHLSMDLKEEYRQERRRQRREQREARWRQHLESIEMPPGGHGWTLSAPAVNSKLGWDSVKTTSVGSVSNDFHQMALSAANPQHLRWNDDGNLSINDSSNNNHSSSPTWSDHNGNTK